MFSLRLWFISRSKPSRIRDLTKLSRTLALAAEPTGQLNEQDPITAETGGNASLGFLLRSTFPLNDRVRMLPLAKSPLRSSLLVLILETRGGVRESKLRYARNPTASESRNTRWRRSSSSF